MKFITRRAAKKLCSHSKKAFDLLTLTLLIFSSFLLLNQTAKALPTCAIEQITDETNGSSFIPSINADGTRIAFVSLADINGGNPEGNTEIYLYTCLDPATARNIPTLSEWGLISMAGILGIVGFMVMRRRKVTA